MPQVDYLRPLRLMPMAISWDRHLHQASSPNSHMLRHHPSYVDSPLEDEKRRMSDLELAVHIHLHEIDQLLPLSCHSLCLGR